MISGKVAKPKKMDIDKELQCYLIQVTLTSEILNKDCIKFLAYILVCISEVLCEFLD